jgi:alkaline phosphatase D
MRDSRKPHARSLLITRRQVLQGIAAAGSAFALSSCSWSPREAGVPRFRNDPFSLGVASGYPLSNAVVLWTRLAPEPLAPDGGMSPATIPVTWEIAEDEHFRKAVRKGVAHAEPAWAHSLHVEVDGLKPARDYWYRFTAGNARSTTGRTRTAPAPGMTVDRVRIAVASCQEYEHGYYTAYQQMIRDDPDLVLHVGDYIYELGWGKDLVRSHASGECLSLGDYRARHALYRSDPDLARAHAAAPWLVTWDDHDVDNDYAGSVSEQGEPAELFLARRAAAYQAFYEHMPLPERAAPAGAGMQLYMSCSYGDLLNVYMLDGRQYRSERACAYQGRQRKKRSRPEWCTDFNDTNRTMLGAEQETWLAGSLRQSTARWNVLGQATVLSYTSEEARPARMHWIDGWSGYPVAQARIARELHESRVSNPVVVSGDVHAFMAADLHLRPDDPESPRVAGELVTTSITSEPPPESVLESHLRYNPNVRFATGLARGYLRVEVSPTLLRGDFIGMDTITQRTSGSRVLASYVQEPGTPGLQRA